MAGMPPAMGRPQGLKNDGLTPMAPGAEDPKNQLPTYIYDFFLKRGKLDLAQAMLKTDLGVRHRPPGKPSPHGRDVNGVDDLDSEPKDEFHKKLDAMPVPLINDYLPNEPFLESWWSVFWDIWSASKNRSSSGNAEQYLTAQNRFKQQAAMLRNSNGAMNAMNAMNPMGPMGMNGMPNGMNGQLRQQALNNNTRALQMQNQMRNMPNQQGQMQRDGSGMQFDGQQRGQSPMAGDNEPSPKRARLDGQMVNPMAMGRSQAPGMPMPNGAGPMPNVMPNGFDPSAMSAAGFNGMNKNMANFSARFGNVNQMNQEALMKNLGAQQGNSPMMPGPDSTGMDMMGGDPSGQMRAGASQQGGALADYQMQLMLLEQQNKKRLLMARQEQEVSQPGGGPPMAGAGSLMGQGASFAGMSPRRNGQSPSPNDAMKRANSAMGQGSPRPDGMAVTRGSPAPGFEPGQMPPGGMNAQLLQQMNNGMMRPAFPGAPNGQLNAQQQMEVMNRARMAGGWGPNGPQIPGPMQQFQQPGDGRQSNPMPPPQGPPPGQAGRTQPPSPQQQNQAGPPTPSQNKNANNKGNKKDAKDTKKPKKNAKGTTAATPSSEAENPPTPTPPTPITPTAHNNPFSNKTGNPAANGQAQGQQPGQPAVPPPSDAMNAPPFGGSLEANDLGDAGFNLDFSNGIIDNTDVLDGFDFDSFLQVDDGANGFGDFDPSSMGMGGDGVQMGTNDS